MAVRKVEKGDYVIITLYGHNSNDKAIARIEATNAVFGIEATIINVFDKEHRNYIDGIFVLQNDDILEILDPETYPEYFI
jgi:hypothetical protein